MTTERLQLPSCNSKSEFCLKVTFGSSQLRHMI